MANALEEELDAVDAILMGGVERDGSDTVRISLRPLTASDEEKQYVSLVLELTFTHDYPDTEPKVKVRSPRGLSEDSVEGLVRGLLERCTQFVGSPVIFELIEMCREFLSESNHPATACAICLDDIVDGDAFVKTTCYHYFHSFCLGRYVRHAKDEHAAHLRDNAPVPGMTRRDDSRPTCPVCREPLVDVRLETWLSAAAPKREAEAETAFAMPTEMVEMQKKMQAIYLAQKAKGSIIDIEQEEKKFLVSTQQSSEELEAGAEAASDASPSASVSVTNGEAASKQAAANVPVQGKKSSNGSGDFSQGKDRAGEDRSRGSHGHGHHRHDRGHGYKHHGHRHGHRAAHHRRGGGGGGGGGRVEAGQASTSSQAQNNL